MHYTVPRPVYEKLAATFNDREAAERFASSIEEAVQEIEAAARRETIDKIYMIKTEIKEDLSKILVTRELFEERFGVINERFDNINFRFELVEKRFEHVEDRFKKMDDRFEQMDNRFEQINDRFASMKENFNERFKRTELWLKFIAGLSLFGITVANPEFIEIIKTITR